MLRSRSSVQCGCCRKLDIYIALLSHFRQTSIRSLLHSLLRGHPLKEVQALELCDDALSVCGQPLPATAGEGMLVQRE